MGTVYKARDLIGGRWVAVKLLAPFLASDEEYVKRFFQEARNLQKLHHPLRRQVPCLGYTDGLPARPREEIQHRHRHSAPSAADIVNDADVANAVFVRQA